MFNLCGSNRQRCKQGQVCRYREVNMDMEGGERQPDLQDSTGLS